MPRNSGSERHASRDNESSSKRKRGSSEDDASAASPAALTMNQQILDALNGMNNTLRSIDARLGRMERNGQQLGGRQSRWQEPLPAQTIVTGSWKFAKSSSFDSSAKIFVHNMSSYYPSGTPNTPESACGKSDEDGLVLTGELYFDTTAYKIGSNHPSIHGGFELGLHGRTNASTAPVAPVWSFSHGDGANVRDLLPQIVFNDKAEIMHKSGIYTLAVKYNISGSPHNQDAGLIVGEMEFNSKGYVNAEGADWDRLLNNQRQTQLPYSHNTRGVATWLPRKICEPWQDGDVTKIKLDTNENTVVFQKGDIPMKTFWNALAFTHSRTTLSFLSSFEYMHIVAAGVTGQ